MFSLLFGKGTRAADNQVSGGRSKGVDPILAAHKKAKTEALKSPKSPKSLKSLNKAKGSKRKIRPTKAASYPPPPVTKEVPETVILAYSRSKSFDNDDDTAGGATEVIGGEAAKIRSRGLDSKMTLDRTIWKVRGM